LKEEDLNEKVEGEDAYNGSKIILLQNKTIYN
jgi:hypothetical protein